MTLADSMRTRHAPNGVILPDGWTIARYASRHGKWSAYYRGKKVGEGFTTRREAIAFCFKGAKGHETSPPTTEQDEDEDVLRQLRAAREAAGARCG